MKPQFCKVGRMTPITQANHALDILEYRYKNFSEKAAKSIDSRLADFFEGKAKSFKKLIEELA